MIPDNQLVREIQSKSTRGREAEPPVGGVGSEHNFFSSDFDEFSLHMFQMILSKNIFLQFFFLDISILLVNFEGRGCTKLNKNCLQHLKPFFICDLKFLYLFSEPNK